jgi:hypothetical protein
MICVTVFPQELSTNNNDAAVVAMNGVGPIRGGRDVNSLSLALAAGNSRVDGIKKLDVV